MKKNILSLFSVIVLFVLFGCTREVYVPVETTKTEYRDKLIRDSIVLYDSIFVKERIKGDTVFLSEYKYKYLYRDKILRDSIFLNDTIRVPLPIEKRLSKWEKIKMDTGGWAIGVISVFLIYIIIWLIKRFK